MIDTDRYEGHTPGPWVALHRYWRKEGSHGGGLREEGAEDAGNYAQSLVYTKAYLNAEDDWYDSDKPTLDWSSVVNGVCIENKATANLVADAPLLLEEYERLRRELDTQYKYIEWLEQYAPKAGEYNLAWDAYEAQMEGDE